MLISLSDERTHFVVFFLLLFSTLFCCNSDQRISIRRISTIQRNLNQKLSTKKKERKTESEEHLSLERSKEIDPKLKSPFYSFLGRCHGNNKPRNKNENEKNVAIASKSIASRKKILSFSKQTETDKRKKRVDAEVNLNKTRRKKAEII